MIVGIGVDIVDIERIRKCFSESFIHKILTPKEQAIMSTYSKPRQIEFTAGRFAAKEAIIKAMSQHMQLSMKEIEILHNEQGAPICFFQGFQMLISIAHETNTAIAYVLAQEESHDS